MFEDKLTLHRTVHGGEQTIPCGRDYTITREKGDIRIYGGFYPIAKISVFVLLRADGSWQHWYTEYGRDDSYLHIYEVSELPVPTQAQRKTVAEWKFERTAPYGLAVGASVTTWAFDGKGPWEIANEFGYEVPLLAGGEGT